MKDMSAAPVDYRIDTTAWGTWRSFLSPTGQHFREFRSHMAILGWPLIHYTNGVSPETGRRKMASGFIAVGRKAFGVVAIGQLAIGLVTIGQASLGLLLGIGQLSTGVVAVGQAAIGLQLGLGQLATGAVAIGQIGWGRHVLAQFGSGTVRVGHARRVRGRQAVLRAADFGACAGCTCFPERRLLYLVAPSTR